VEMIKELIEKLPELYQDVEINGVLIARGKRDCCNLIGCSCDRLHAQVSRWRPGGV